MSLTPIFNIDLILFNITLRVGNIRDVLNFSMLNKRIRKFYNKYRSRILLEFVNFEDRVKIDIDGQYIQHIPLKIASLNTALVAACRNGFLNIATEMLDRGADDFESTIYRTSDPKIIELLVIRGSNVINLDHVMHVMCTEGYFNIIKLLIDIGYTDYNRAFDAVCRNSTNYESVIEILELLIEKGADDYDGALHNACAHSQLEVLEFLLVRSPISINKILIDACSYPSIRVEVVELLIKHGANDLNTALSCVRDFPVAELLVKRGANDFDGALRTICSSEHSRFVPNKCIKFIITSGVKNLNEILLVMCESNVDDPSIIPYFIRYGADNLSYALCTAVLKNNRRIVRQLIESSKDFNKELDLNSALSIACHEERIICANTLIYSGANNLNDLLIDMVHKRNYEMVGFLTNRGAKNLVRAARVAMELGFNEIHVMLKKKLKRKKEIQI